jgi:parvulin-like peptidyl-prolyl isomerase
MSKDNKSKQINKSRKKNRNLGMMIGSIIILIITIVAFIFVPAMSQSGSGNTNELVFGSYGDSKIKYVSGNYFARQIEYINNIYRDSDTLSDNIEFKRQQVWQIAFNQAVMQKAMEEDLINSGVTITDNQIDVAMVERGPFTVDGKFSEELYRNTSSSTKFDLRKRFREELLREQYISDVMYGVSRSEGLIDFISELGADEKSFNYAIFNSENIEDSFFADYAVANISNFSKASLNRITIFNSEDEAVKLQARLSKGEISFKDAALAESKDSFAADGGNAGEIYFHELNDDLESEDNANKVFALKDKEISQVIATSYGWVIFQMINTPYMPELTSTETINEIRTYMSRNDKGLIEDYLVSKGTDFVTALSENNFKALASTMGLVNGTTDYFAVNYGNNRMIPSSISSATQQNESFSNAAYDEIFLERLFSLKNAGDISDPLVVDNTIVVAQLVGNQTSTKIPEESMDYFKYQVESEISGYMQSDLQTLVMNSEKFENNFIKTYANIFYSN